MKKIIASLAFLLVIQFCNAQDARIDSLFLAFKSWNFEGAVKNAKSELVNYQKEIIPQLIKLLTNTNYSKLGNADWLMYPGTNEIKMTHGYIIPYELDWISVRAGWLLEELTFKDFGYSTLPSYTYSEIMESFFAPGAKKITEMKWKNRLTKKQIIQHRYVLAQKVKKWWQQKQENWTRVSAIKEALLSNNEKRQLTALNYLQNSETKCDNLKVLYSTEIRPAVISLKQASNENIKRFVEMYLQDDKDLGHIESL